MAQFGMDVNVNIANIDQHPRFQHLLNIRNAFRSMGVVAISIIFVAVGSSRSGR